MAGKHLPVMFLTILIAIPSLALGQSQSPLFLSDIRDGFIPVCTAEGMEQHTSAVSDGIGGMIVGWYDDRNPYSPGLYIQRITAAGEQAWAPDGVRFGFNPNGERYKYDLASDGAGGAYIAYREGNADTVYVDYIDASGSLVWAQRSKYLLNGRLATSQLFLIPDQTGVSLVWNVQGHTNFQHFRKDGQLRFDIGGFSLGKKDRADAKPVPDGKGGLYFAEIHYRNPQRTNGHDIVLRHLDKDGKVIWANRIVRSCERTYCSLIPTLAYDESTHRLFVCCWGTRPEIESGEWDIYLHCFTGDGDVLWTSSGSIVSDAERRQHNGTLVPTGDGGVILLWQDDRDIPRDSAERIIYAQKYSSAGQPEWPAGGVSVIAGYEANYPQAILDGKGGVYVVDYGTAHLQHVFSDGHTWDGDTATYLISQHIVQHAKGLAISGMYDGDLYYVYLDTDGTVLSTPTMTPDPIPDNLSIHVYPQPARDRVSICMSSKRDTFLKVQLFDVLGRCVLRHNAEIHAQRTATTEIRTEDLPDGMYYLQVRGGSEYAHTRVIISR